MRIIYHHRTLGDGAEGIHVREMVDAFRRLGHEVFVVGPVGEKGSGLNGKRQVLSNVKRRIPTPAFEVGEIGYAAYSIISICKAIHQFNPHFIYDRYALFNFGPILSANSVNIPVFLEINAPLAWERAHEPDEKLHFKRVALMMERWIARRATKTFVVSTSLRDHLEDHGVPKEKMMVLPNGVNPEKFRPRPKNMNLLQHLGIDLNDVVIGFTGILRPWHGLELLIDAVVEIKKMGINPFLLIVGDGPYREKIEHVIAASGIASNTYITGRVSHETVVEYANLFDIGITVKSTFYASPMKVIEYMALEKAVLVPDSSNFLDLIDPQKDGWVFHQGDVDSLSDALYTLCHDTDLRRQLGQAARRKVDTRLNWRWNANYTCDLAQKAIGEIRK